MINMTWYPGKIIGDVFRGGGNPDIRDLEKELRKFCDEYGIHTIRNICEYLEWTIAHIKSERWEEAKLNLEEALKWLNRFERRYKEKLAFLLERFGGGREYLYEKIDTIKSYIRFLEDVVRVRGDYHKLGMTTEEYEDKIFDIHWFCVDFPLDIHWICGIVYALTKPLEKL